MKRNVVIVRKKPARFTHCESYSYHSDQARLIVLASVIEYAACFPYPDRAPHQRVGRFVVYEDRAFSRFLVLYIPGRNTKPRNLAPRRGGSGRLY